MNRLASSTDTLRPAGQMAQVYLHAAQQTLSYLRSPDVGNPERREKEVWAYGLSYAYAIAVSVQRATIQLLDTPPDNFSRYLPETSSLSLAMPTHGRRNPLLAKAVDAKQFAADLKEMNESVARLNSVDEHVLDTSRVVLTHGAATLQMVDRWNEAVLPHLRYCAALVTDDPDSDRDLVRRNNDVTQAFSGIDKACSEFLGNLGRMGEDMLARYAITTTVIGRARSKTLLRDIDFRDQLGSELHRQLTKNGFGALNPTGLIQAIDAIQHSHGQSPGPPLG